MKLCDYAIYGVSVLIITKFLSDFYSNFLTSIWKHLVGLGWDSPFISAGR